MLTLSLGSISVISLLKILSWTLPGDFDISLLSQFLIKLSDNLVGFFHFGCNPCQIENDDGSKSSSYLISFDKETFPISEDALGRVMEYQKEQFKQLIRLFGEDLR